MGIMELLPLSTNHVWKLREVSSNDDVMKPCAKVYTDWFARFRFHFFCHPKNVKRKIRQVVVECFGIVDQSPQYGFQAFGRRKMFKFEFFTSHS